MIWGQVSGWYEDGVEGITAMFEAGNYVSVYLAGAMLESFSKAEVDSLCDADTALHVS